MLAHFFPHIPQVSIWFETIIFGIMHIFLCVCMHPFPTAFQNSSLNNLKTKIIEIHVIFSLSVVFQATMVKAAWKHSKTWRPRRASVSPTLVRYSGQDNHSKLRNAYIMYFTTKIGLLFSYLVNTCISHRGWNEVVECGESLLHMKQERFKHVTTVRDHICICLTCFPRQNLEQCWRA